MSPKCAALIWSQRVASVRTADVLLIRRADEAGALRAVG